MKVQIYRSLPADAAWIRKTVFMEEQGFREEFDEIDGRAVHFVLYDDVRPVATCRLFDDAELAQGYILGRFAICREDRGRGLGRVLMDAVERYARQMGGKRIRLHAQCRVEGFYERLGFCAYGEIEPEEDCPHVWMKKEI